MLSPQYVLLIFTLLIYILIMFAFNKVRKKYTGGKVGNMINLILVTVSLLFVADYMLLLTPILSETVITTCQTLFRTTALSFLAYGGVKMAD